MQRAIYRAQCLEGREADGLARLRESTPALRQRIADEQLLMLSVFRWLRNLFLYDELPQVKEPLVHEKGLKATGTPANWADSRMDLHFIPWPDGTQYNREIELVLGL